ncbi:hypothetical protein Q4I32_006755 [Leishmania shawi]|uniref:Uncharacterized protein n=1 Tax=Leishmania shawi TaxID=5680 RepID=A0AAW3BC70_9TRYP
MAGSHKRHVPRFTRCSAFLGASIETIIPRLQHHKKDIGIVPVAVSYLSFAHVVQIASFAALGIAKATVNHQMAWGEFLVVAISTDAVCFGNEDQGPELHYALFDGPEELKSWRREGTSTKLSATTSGASSAFHGCCHSATTPALRGTSATTRGRGADDTWCCAVGGLATSFNRA